MGTTIEIPDEQYEQVESKAARQGIGVGDLIADALRAALGEARLFGQRRITFPLLRIAQPGVLSAETVRAAEEAAAQQEDSARAGAL